MGTQSPRKAYCTGCGKTFPKMHLLMNHRGTFRCGGRFLLVEEQNLINRIHRIKMHRASRYHQERGKYLGFDEMFAERINEARIDLQRMRHDRLQGG